MVLSISLQIDISIRKFAHTIQELKYQFLWLHAGTA